MSEEAPEKEQPADEPDQGKTTPPTESDKENRIVILRERDIPFDEERPPNFSPNFAIKVHRVRKSSEQEDEKT